MRRYPGSWSAFLAVLASALSVALSGEAAVAAVGFADQAQRQGHVDARQYVIDALRLLLSAPTGQDHG